MGLAWSPDGTRLASASRDKTSKLFNAANGESLMTYSGPRRAGVRRRLQRRRQTDLHRRRRQEDSRLESRRRRQEGRDRRLRPRGVRPGDARRTRSSALGRQDACSSIASRASSNSRRTPGHTDAVYCVAYHPGTALRKNGDKVKWSCRPRRRRQLLGRSANLERRGRRAGRVVHRRAAATSAPAGKPPRKVTASH